MLTWKIIIAKIQPSMKTTLLLIASLLFSVGLQAQADVIPTEKGKVTMTPILHSTLVLEWNDQTIYMDPYGGAERFANFEEAELICITHLHADHFNKETLEGLNTANTTLIVPQSVADELGELEFKEVKVLANGENLDWMGLNVKAVPMYNLPEKGARHPKGWGNGYVLTIGGKRFYFSGDTEDIKEMRALENIDYAFVCMNLPYTMTVEQAADAVLEFKPKVVYPFHFRGRDGFSDIDKFQSLVKAGSEDIEVRQRDWYPDRDRD